MDYSESTFRADVEVSTDHPHLKPLVRLAEQAETGTVDHYLALANIFNAAAVECAANEGFRRGRVKGNDEGAAPFLEGSWLRRAWTAARS